LKKHKKYLVLIFIAILLTIAAACAWSAFDLVRFWKTPGSSYAREPVRFMINPGESFETIAKRLEGSHLISHSLKFKIMARYHGLDTRIKAGEYMLSKGMTPAAIMERLTSGDVILHKVTIPEGFTMYQVAKRMEKAGLCDAKTFLKWAQNPDFVQRLGISGNSVEGYLFPDTYMFAQHPGAKKIIEAMVKRFNSVFSDKWRKRAQSLGMTIHQIVTLASIIEKETGVESERPIIASVFYNRLKRHMRLASDPTVIYGIKDFNGNITQKDLKRKTPYNTYVIFGLPPGPIANPGRSSLKAALWPAKTDYIYFVAKPDRTHFFSTNLSEHNRAVFKYQKHHFRRR